MNRLMQKLEKIMPKRVLERDTAVCPLTIRDYPLRRHADAFAHAIESDLPRDTHELASLLWVFAEITHGDMDYRYQVAMKGWRDSLALHPQPPIVIPRLRRDH